MFGCACCYPVTDTDNRKVGPKGNMEKIVTGARLAGFCRQADIVDGAGSRDNRCGFISNCFN